MYQQTRMSFGVNKMDTIHFEKHWEKRKKKHAGFHNVNFLCTGTDNINTL